MKIVFMNCILIDDNFKYLTFKIRYFQNQIFKLVMAFDLFAHMNEICFIKLMLKIF